MGVHVFDTVVEFSCYVVRKELLEEEVSGYGIKRLPEVYKASVHIAVSLLTILYKEVV